MVGGGPCSEAPIAQVAKDFGISELEDTSMGAAPVNHAKWPPSVKLWTSTTSTSSRAAPGEPETMQVLQLAPVMTIVSILAEPLPEGPPS